MQTKISQNIIFVFFLLILPVIGISQSINGIELSQHKASLKPGEHFTLKLYTPYDKSYSGILSIPEGWRILAKKEKQDGDRKVFYYTIHTPSDGMAQSYSIRFQLEKNDIVQETKSTEVKLEEVREVNLMLASKPERASEGDTILVEYLISNVGNVAEKLTLSSSMGQLEQNLLTIEPKSSQTVGVKYIINTEGTYNEYLSSELEVQTTYQEQALIRYASIPIIRTTVKTSDPFLRFPLEVGVGYLGFNTVSQQLRAFQFFLEGRGFLDKNKKHYADLIIRGPNEATFPLATNFDQYSLSYKFKDKFWLKLGDYNNRVTNLTELGRFGRGAKAGLVLGQKHELTGFYNKARFFRNQNDAAGVGYHYRFNGNAKVGVDLVSKRLTEQDRAFRSDLVSLNGEVNWEKFQIKSEVAAGSVDGNIDYGAYNKVRVDLKHFKLSNEVVYAGKDFFGFFNNSMFINTNLSIPINQKLSIGANHNITDINQSLDDFVFAIAPYSTNLLAYLSLQPNHKHSFVLSFNTRESEDRQEPVNFDYREDRANLTYTLNTKWINWFNQGTLGRVQNFLAGDAAPERSSYGFISQPMFKITENFRLGFYGEYQNTSRLSSNNEIEELYFYGANTSLRFGKLVNMNFGYRNNFAADELFQRRSLLFANIEFDFKRHNLTFNANQVFDPRFEDSRTNALFFSINYRFRLNVPIAKKKDLGRVSGRLTGLSEGIKKSGVLVQIGQYKVLTDASGGFEFPDLAPDTYQVKIVDDQNEVDVLPALPSPFTIQVMPDSSQYMDVPLVRVGSVEGKVAFRKRISKALDTGETPMIYVKIWNGSEKYLTSVDKKGNFAFDRLKPGEWKVRGIVPGKKGKYEIVNNDIVLDIEPGKAADLVFQLRPIERRILYTGKTVNLTAKR